MNIFIVVLIIGIYVNTFEILPAMFIPPLLFLAAVLPPLWAIAWFLGRYDITIERLSWRRGIVALAGGASVAVFLTILLEILLSAGILVLGFDLFGTTTNTLNAFFRDVGRSQSTSSWMDMLKSPAFVYVLVQFALIAPLVEEFAKPLVTLPILRHLDQKQTFWVGALAGAGFAALESSVYGTIGIQIWIGFLLVRALGSAIQPLGSGLVALGWRDVLRKEPRGGWSSWTRRYGIAVTLHAAWNAASLLVVFPGKLLLTGNLSRLVGWPGIAAFGMLFLFLILLGSSALWLGRELWQGKMLSFPDSQAMDGAESTSLNRMVAIGTVACLMVILPAGILLSKLWLR